MAEFFKKFFFCESYTIEIEFDEDIKDFINTISFGKKIKVNLIFWNNEHRNKYKSYWNSNENIYYHTKEEFEKKINKQKKITNSIIIFMCLENYLKNETNLNLQKIINSLIQLKKNYIWLTKSPIYRYTNMPPKFLEYKENYSNSYHVPTNIKKFKEIKMDIKNHNTYSFNNGYIFDKKKTL